MPFNPSGEMGKTKPKKTSLAQKGNGQAAREGDVTAWRQRNQLFTVPGGPQSLGIASSFVLVWSMCVT